ncbi:MAG: hypothetical protein HFF77_04340 [Oscillospiraceae bacterium]|jgi:predicted metal-dependent peptidase|nr:hypothetical protein [Oscillospiraceae bacterium]
MRNITDLLSQIKGNIAKIEGGGPEEPALDAIRTDFLEMLELIKLFLISERDSYYGYFLINMRFEVDFYANLIAGIKLNAFPPVFASNPLLLCGFTLKEIIFSVCHEIDHVLFNHPAEMIKVNPDGDPDTFYEFNLAADAAVNDRINHEIAAEHHNFMTAPEGLITSQTLSRMFQLGKIRPMESYAYYFALIHKKRPPMPDGGTPQNGQESILSKNQRQDREHSGGGEGRGSKGQLVTAKSCGGHVSDHDWNAGQDAGSAAAAAKELVNAAVSTMSEESRGLMPAHFTSQAALLNRPPVLAWQTILKKYVGTITANKRRTRMRLNRRQPERFDLSGTMDDKLLKIVVAIDTSGSMSDGMIAKVFNEIFAILAKRRHEITVIECDAKVQRVYRAKTPADIKQKVAGRGGTWFSPAIEYVNSDRYFRDALLIYFTDGYGEAEIPRPKTYRNMWVVFGGAENLSLREPFGAVMSL